MDKRITPQGILKSERRMDKKPSQNIQKNRKECTEKFEIDSKEFPSLNEITDKCSNEKYPLEFKSSSYSEKLKNIPNKSKSSFKFEVAQDSPRSEFFFPKEESLMGTSKKNISPSTPFQSVDSGLVAAGYSNRNNTGETKYQVNQSNERKVPTHPSENRGFSHGKKEIPECKDDYFIERNRRARPSSDKMRNFPDTGKCQYHPPSRLGDAKAYERRPTVKSSLQGVQSSVSSSGIRNAIRQEKNVSKPHDRIGTEQDREGKKKKKRKSKVKRQAALQSGKILVLTPELHSRILNQSNVSNFKQNQCVVTNINDSEEYPELGSSVKTNKENAIKNVEPSSKDSMHLEKDQENKQNDLISNLPTSSIDSDVIKKDQETVTKPQDKEKAPVLLKDPISVSIFDMLQSAMTKKKDTARKDEIVRLDSAMGNIISLPRVIGRKGISSAVNPLDSSKPTVKRGKEREKPKVKKPSRMRKLILIGRQLRKKEMENFEDNENTDAAYTSLSDDCLSPSKFSSPDESSFVQNCESEVNSLSPSAAVDQLEIEACVSAENPLHELGENANSPELPSEETERSVFFSTDSGLKNSFNDNSIEDSTKSVVFKPNAVAEDLKNISLSDKLSNELNLNPIMHLKNETINSSSGDNFSNNGVNNENSSPILKALHAKSSSESMFSAEARPMVNFVKQENKSDLNFSNINTQVSDSPQLDVAVLNSQENYPEEERSLLTEISCDNLQMIENSSNKLMNLMKNITVKPKITDELRIEAVKTLIHSRKFRKYCNHFICKGIDEVVFALLDDLARFQDRMHQKDPVKARIRKRLLYGIKEIKRHMKLKKLKGIILATDIEDIKTEGGLNDVVNEIITLAEAYHIPYIFSHRRFNLGKVCRKGVPVSCVGIFNYEGSEKNFKRIIELQEECKLDYLLVTNALSEVLSCDEVTEVLRLGKGVPEKLQEIRTALLKDHFKVESDESKQHEFECVKSLKDTNSESSKESNLCETNEIDKDKVYDILLKYNLI